MASILLIEDMNGVRSSLNTVLSAAGHRVIEASNGAIGLETARQSAFDLVITDIIMPECDGSEVILALKTSRSTTPVLAISGGGGSVSAASALMVAKETADAILEKPFSRNDLLKAVEQLIN